MLTRAEFRATLMDTWQRTAWRWECQGVYREPNEREPLRRFLAGEPDDLTWFQRWLTRVRDWTAAGQRMGRVRMLTDPITDYLRFELSITPPAVQAGEDIRFVMQDQALALGLPDHDFWLFDDARVAVLHFGDEGLSGIELITESGKVREYREWQRAAVQAAVPISEVHLTT